jgi:uncharacterized protein (DUF1015 family)
MVQIKTFEAIRPPANMAPKVSSPPYDVISTDEARSIAEGNPHSFLHVIRPEINLPEDTDPHDDAVYTAGKAALDRLMAEDVLIRDDEPAIHLYRQVRQGRSQTGIVCCCHVEDYQNDVIRKHEKTRPDKEDDRTRHLLALDAQPGPVFLAYREDEAIAAQVAEDMSHRPSCHFITPDGVTHTTWRVDDADAYIKLLEKLPHIYVADGHHRTASAARAAEARATKNPEHTGKEEYNWFLSVLFPANTLTILPYNRVVNDLNGLTEEAFLDALRTVGTLTLATTSEPTQPRTFGIYVGSRWWSLAIDERHTDSSDVIASLDVALLQDRVLSPILGIGDPRTDTRIGFVGGSRGTVELERRASDDGVAFALYATQIEQLLDVSDAGQCMPPKSTWFEPKLRSGLFVHALDSAASHSNANHDTQEARP